MIEIKQGDNLVKIEKGKYLLIFDPYHTSFEELNELVDLLIQQEIFVFVLSSHKPESIRFLKAEETVTVKGESK